MTETRRLISTLSVVLVTFGLVWVAAQMGLRINVTPSAPVGLWMVEKAQLSELRRDEYILICPPHADWVRTLVTNGVLPRGHCADGVAPFIKRVAALPGTRFSVSDDGIRVEGELIAATEPLPSWPRHQATLAAVPNNTLLVYQNAHPGSLDSRYLGPFPLQGHLQKARLLVAF